MLGGDVSLLASGRLDNQVSCWAATDVTGRLRSGRRGVDGRPQRPRGGRVGEHRRRQRAAPRARPRTPRPRTRRHARRPPPSPCGVDVRVGRQRPRGAPQLHRASRSRAPAARQRRPGDQAERQPALRDVGPHGGRVPARVRGRRRAVAGLRVAQQHAVRLDDRAAHRDPARDRHRRRRRAAAVDALGSGAVRGPRSGVAGFGARRLLRPDVRRPEPPTRR